MDREFLTTLHVHTDDLPFVEFLPGIETRLLHARRSEGLTVTHIRAQPGAVASLHRHPSPVYGWTISGQWGHDRNYLYRPGTYIYETPGVIHRFMGGDAVTEAVFISTGGVETIDPETFEVTSTSSPADMIDRYVAKCEEVGVTPAILT